jgi:hypothetical protein
MACGSPKSKMPPLSTGDPCNYECALSIHIWAESREVSASDGAGRNQIGDALSPGLRRKLDREGDSWPATISGGDHVAVMESAKLRISLLLLNRFSSFAQDLQIARVSEEAGPPLSRDFLGNAEANQVVQGIRHRRDG